MAFTTYSPLVSQEKAVVLACIFDLFRLYMASCGSRAKRGTNSEKKIWVCYAIVCD